MTDLYQKQIELENEYNTQSVIDSQKQVLDAYANGRAADLGNGRILVARAFESAIESYKELLSRKATGTRGKYLGLLRPIDPEVVVMLGLRVVIDGCAKAEPVSLQNTLTLLGKCIETEALLMATGTVSQAYTDRTVEYLDTKGTKSISHRYRTLMAGAEALGFTWTSWSVQERVSTARIVLDCLYEETGLFQWYTTGSSSMYYIKPTDVLAKYLTDAIDAAKGITRLPPMLTPPMDWEGQYSGGYLTEWARSRTPMCSLRMHTQAQRKWVIDGLGSERAAPLRQAMNKAQRTPYRVNHEVLEVLRQALGYGTGILGLPSTVAAPRPVFPFPEGWLKDDATETELDQFSFWKTQVAEWHTLEAKRVGRKVSLLSKCRELIRFKDEAAMYFPTFIDWRGRVYFRSTIHPQLNDAVKGCLEFAEGKRLGSVGLYWLKVHVANCCGYDKHDPDIKVKWCEDNWAMIKHFIDNPFDIDAPEPDTAFTLLQAAYALRAAYELDNPEDYICHVPVAMDATCSGLQHLSALTRDEVGGKFTNLIDSTTDQKADIYLQVGTTAQEAKLEFIDDVVVSKFWDATEITRSMSKKPVMTYVYGSTLLSTMDSIALDMSSMGLEPIKDASGKILYTLNKLAIPVAKALRKGVESTVPRCAEIMKYLQTVCRRSKSQHMQWVTPVGTPVVNWSENQVRKLLKLRSMGVEGIIMKYGDGTYNVRAATQGVVPNFVHSMDSCHLCMTLNDFDGQVVPIHDSFGTHPSDVPELHKSLRKTFVELYSQYKIEDLLEVNSIDLEEYPVPPQGSLDIQDVKDSRFMFC